MEWVTGRLTVEEAETLNAVEGLPFGGVNHAWENLKAMMLDGDALVSFSSDPATWRALCGREGVALVRDDRVVAQVITTLN